MSKALQFLTGYSHSKRQSTIFRHVTKFGHVTWRGQQEYVVTTRKLEGSRGRGPKETMLDSLESWHRGPSELEMPGSVWEKRLWTDITNGHKTLTTRFHSDHMMLIMNHFSMMFISVECQYLSSFLKPYYCKNVLLTF